MVAEESGRIYNQVEFKVTGCFLMMDFPHFFQNEETYRQTEIFSYNGPEVHLRTST